MSGLAERLSARGVDFLTTREPGGTALGDRLRALFADPSLTIDPVAEAFVVNASRAQHVGEVIEPALRAQRWVLCDRFSSATLAYQGYGRGVDGTLLATLASIATRALEPDLTLLIDVAVELSRERVAARNAERGGVADRLEREPDDFHERVRRGYLELAARDARFAVLDGSQSQAAVLQAAWSVVEAKFLA
jgi:dTMP kinase